jgi:hypothetical protein
MGINSRAAARNAVMTAYGPSLRRAARGRQGVWYTPSILPVVAFELVRHRLRSAQRRAI